jgi:hypothetical protein
MLPGALRWTCRRVKSIHASLITGHPYQALFFMTATKLTPE